LAPVTVEAIELIEYSKEND